MYGETARILANIQRNDETTNGTGYTLLVIETDDGSRDILSLIGFT